MWSWELEEFLFFFLKDDPTKHGGWTQYFAEDGLSSLCLSNIEITDIHYHTRRIQKTRELTSSDSII